MRLASSLLMHDCHELPHPLCHLEYMTGPGRAAVGSRTAVWICEYPYHTMRLNGPSSECEGCPVWKEMQRNRHVLDGGGEDPTDAVEQGQLTF